MLENIDLGPELKKAEYKREYDELEQRLPRLQRRVIETGLPVVVVVEGWHVSGKGHVINRLILNLDPRHYKVHFTGKPTEEEVFRPFLWRFWTRTPADGKIAVFDRSWYTRVLHNRVEGGVEPDDWNRAYQEINAFERQLTDDGTLIVKLLLHISQKKQKHRFKKLAKSESAAWRVTDASWAENDRYDDYLAAMDDMLARTGTSNAPWTIVEAHDERWATVKVMRTVAEAIESSLVAREDQSPVKPAARSSVETPSILSTVDLSPSLDRDAYNDRLKDLQRELRELHNRAYAARLPVVVVYEGWDAAGKGGNIKRLVQRMDPRGYEVIPIAAPSDLELRHHYLWRFWQALPKAGHVAIFDRSWYGRVMVERVEGFATEAEWKRAYHEINEFEEQLTGFGTVLVKFWLQIDKDEQLRRFEARQANPHKQWKITEDDWRNREKWDTYRDAVNEMLYRTSTSHAPWTIVEANSKLYARIKALETVIAAMKKGLGD